MECLGICLVLACYDQTLPLLCPAGHKTNPSRLSVKPAIAVTPPPHTLTQAAFLEALAAEGDEEWAAGAAAVVPLLREKPELAAEVEALAKSKASGALARVLLAAAAAPLEAAEEEEARTDSQQRRQQLVAVLLPVYCEKVLSAKERGAPAALTCWAAVATAANEEQVTGGW